MAFSFPKASIVVASYNNEAGLEQVLDAMLGLNYPNQFEIIVVDDGSSDNTVEMLAKKFGREKRITIIAHAKNKGVCAARNEGIKAAKFPIVVNMDHDCIPERNWLRQLVKGFVDEGVGVVSSFGSFGGTSTAFRRELLDQVGGYDERFFYYREDTDLTFNIMDLGYSYRLVKADYLHDHREAKPKGLVATAKYVLKRLCYHQNDALLFKRHPVLAGKFLQVKFGFIVNPIADFKVVANLWEGSSKKLNLGSPRGIVLIRNRTPLHTVAIVLLAIFYVFAVKFFRLIGSIKFRKLLV